jgi:hypothetical protein
MLCHFAHEIIIARTHPIEIPAEAVLDLSIEPPKIEKAFSKRACAQIVADSHGARELQSALEKRLP